MSQENVEAFLEINEALRRGDVEAVLQRADEEGVFLARFKAYAKDVATDIRTERR